MSRVPWISGLPVTSLHARRWRLSTVISTNCNNIIMSFTTKFYIIPNPFWVRDCLFSTGFRLTPLTNVRGNWMTWNIIGRSEKYNMLFRWRHDWSYLLVHTQVTNWMTRESEEAKRLTRETYVEPLTLHSKHEETIVVFCTFGVRSLQYTMRRPQLIIGAQPCSDDWRDEVNIGNTC